MQKFLIVVPALIALAACGGSPESETPAVEADSAPATEAAPADTAEAPAGEKSFAKCTACHKVEKGAPNGVGPNLHGIVGKAVASTEGYAYSAALKAKGGNWDEASLDAYLENPRKAVPGNKMAFAGIGDPAERKALIDWLKEQK